MLKMETVAAGDALAVAVVEELRFALRKHGPLEVFAYAQL